MQLVEKCYIVVVYWKHAEIQEIFGDTNVERTRDTYDVTSTSRIWCLSNQRFPSYVRRLRSTFMSPKKVPIY